MPEPLFPNQSDALVKQLDELAEESEKLRERIHEAHDSELRRQPGDRRIGERRTGSDRRRSQS